MKLQTLAICIGGAILASLVMFCLRLLLKYMHDSTQSPSPESPAAQAADHHLSGIPVYVFDSKVAIPSPSRPNSSSYESCAICLEAYEHGDEVRVLPRCDHMFHKECVDQWLLSHSLQCPTCRNQVIETNVQSERTRCVAEANRDPFNLVALNFHTNGSISILRGRT
ncbi:hypothetical protein HS088_TW01G00959 [Tripterygium wilfordii]|uniref:RING-type domain-containing protein n=1 Tax=Tripterygium wilfordii TaxID=458696 RepID=A0A7J7E3E5_TRIWF|nr:RING-H2 finger protein ATL80-like [Tripterygium wilfordii]KAF5753041.1 hypothetical protein HS088_TW01G00959 [Tripterygium wilfordii]